VPDVVPDDPEGDVGLLLVGQTGAGGGNRGGVYASGQLREAGEDGGENIGIVVRGELAEVLEPVGALDDGTGALEAHPGVDVLGRERAVGAVLVAVELDEDEVPDLDATRDRCR